MDYRDYLFLALAFGLTGAMALGFRLSYVHENPMWDILNASFLLCEFLAASLLIVGILRRLAGQGK